METYRIYDVLIGLILLVCFVIGLPGNLASFIYFSRQKHFAGLVYSVISAIDTLTCLIHIPVMMALFNDRKPGIFAIKIFCVGWNVVFYFQARMSMFLVMSLSVSRTIAIVFPFYQAKKSAFLLSCAVYTLYLFTWHVLIILFGGDDMFYGYNRPNVYCYYFILQSVASFAQIEQTFFALSLGIPPIIVLISFIISVFKLSNRHSAPHMSARHRQASNTLVMFSALFLVCNAPYFIYNTVYMVSFYLSLNYLRPFYIQSTFMFFYSWILAEVISVVVNATLNPVLYFFRIRGLRTWTVNLVKRRKVTRLTMFSRALATVSRQKRSDNGS